MSRQNKDNKKLAQLAATLVAYGRKKGASEVEVSIAQGREFSVNVLNGEIDNLTEAGAKDLALRVFVDKKMATASSSDFAPDTLHRLVDNAVARARLGGDDPFAGLPERETAPAADTLRLYDEDIVAMPADKKVAFARELETVGLKDGRVKKSTGSSFGTYAGAVILANSKGLSGTYERTHAWGSASFQGGDGDNLIEDYWYDAVTRLADLMPAEAIAKKAVDRVARLVGARKIETQNVPVIFEPTVAESLLLRFLAQCASGPAIARRQSFLEGKLDTAVGNDKVTIVDDPLLPGGSGTRPFDAEGVPSRRTTLVDKGVLKSYLLDTYYGRKLKLASTGHAGGPTNFYWAKGDVTPEAMIKGTDKGLLLTGTLGQGTVPTTGDISIGAFGLWIEKGAVAYPVAEITISGNLGELLRRVEAVGSNLEMRRRVSAPTLKISEMTVAGKASAPGQASAAPLRK